MNALRHKGFRIFPGKGEGSRGDLDVGLMPTEPMTISLKMTP